MNFFDNGGFIGRTANYNDTFKYVITPEETSLATLSYVGGKTESGVGTTSNITISLTGLSGGTNSSPSAGDMVIIAVELCGTTNKDFRLSNYTRIADLYFNDTEDTNLFVGYRFMLSTPDTTAILRSGSRSTSDAYAIAVQVWRNVDKMFPLDVAPVTRVQGNTAIPDPNSITPITTGAQIIVAAGAAHDTGVNTFTASYLSNFLTVGADDTNDATVGMGNVAWTSGTYDPAEWTFGGSDSVSYSTSSVVFALRPKTVVDEEEVLGNQKNSGIWSLNSVWNGLKNKITFDNFTIAAWNPDGGGSSTGTIINAIDQKRNLFILENSGQDPVLNWDGEMDGGYTLELPPDDSSFLVTENVRTITFWHMRRSSLGNYTNIVSYYASSLPTNSLDNGWIYRWTTDALGQYDGYISSSNAGYITQALSSSGLTFNNDEWYFYAAIIGASSWRLYRNDTEMFNPSFYPGVNEDNGFKLRFDGEGKFGDIRVHNKALSSTEVSDLYSAGRKSY